MGTYQRPLIGCILYHALLFYELKYRGMNQALLKWLSSYLLKLKQSRITYHLFRDIDMTSGVPEGSQGVLYACKLNLKKCVNITIAEDN